MKKMLFLIVIMISNIYSSYASSRIHLGDTFRDIVFPSSKRITYEYLQMHTKFHSDKRLIEIGRVYNQDSLSQFDNELFKRVHDKIGYAKHNTLKIGDPIKPHQLNISARHSFANGHKMTIDQRTENRKILVALYPHNSIALQTNAEVPHNLKWFSPIIDIMLYPILHTVRKKLAILKLWNAYSGIVMVGIDKDQEWACSYGLVAPKITFDAQFKIPDHIFPRLIEPQDRRTLENSASQLNKPKSDFFEYLPGSGTQYYIEYIQQITHSHFISDLGYMLDQSRQPLPSYQHFINTTTLDYMLDKSSGQPLPEYQHIFIALGYMKNGLLQLPLKQQINARRGWGYDKQQPCHLVDNQYDFAEINIHRRLWSEAYLNNDEFKVINDVLLELHDITISKEHHSDEEHKRIKEILEKNDSLI